MPESHFELVLVAVRGIQTYPGEVVGLVLVESMNSQHVVGEFTGSKQKGFVISSFKLPRLDKALQGSRSQTRCHVVNLCNWCNAELNVGYCLFTREPLK